MRAIYYPFESTLENSLLSVTGDAAHHLNVVRIKTDENVLVMNGEGNILSARVLSVKKNQVDFEVLTKEEHRPKHRLSLAVAMPKKEAFEDILKMAVELGINEIFPLSSEYSQYEYSASERVQRILESALIQSNNPFFPKIHPQEELTSFLKTHQDVLVFFNSRPSTAKNQGPEGNKKTILVGPEGGFSPSEVELILNYSNVSEIHLSTPILRAPTAVASSVGYLLALEKASK